MPFCPNCGFEYREGMDKCPDCNIKLVDKLPPEPEDRYSDEEFVPAYVAYDRMEAEVIKGVLLDAGIPVIQESEPTEMSLPAIYAIPGGTEYLTVPASRLEEAKQVLEESRKAGEALSEDESVEGNDETI